MSGEHDDELFEIEKLKQSAKDIQFDDSEDDDDMDDDQEELNDDDILQDEPQPVPVKPHTVPQGHHGASQSAQGHKAFQKKDLEGEHLLYAAERDELKPVSTQRGQTHQTPKTGILQPKITVDSSLTYTKDSKEANASYGNANISGTSPETGSRSQIGEGLSPIKPQGPPPANSKPPGGLFRPPVRPPQRAPPGQGLKPPSAKTYSDTSKQELAASESKDRNLNDIGGDNISEIRGGGNQGTVNGSVGDADDLFNGSDVSNRSPDFLKPRSDRLDLAETQKKPKYHAANLNNSPIEEAELEQTTKTIDDKRMASVSELNREMIMSDSRNLFADEQIQFRTIKDSEILPPTDKILDGFDDDDDIQRSIEKHKEDASPKDFEEDTDSFTNMDKNAQKKLGLLGLNSQLSLISHKEDLSNYNSPMVNRRTIDLLERIEEKTNEEESKGFKLERVQPLGKYCLKKGQTSEEGSVNQTGNEVSNSSIEMKASVPDKPPSKFAPPQRQLIKAAPPVRGTIGTNPTASSRAPPRRPPFSEPRLTEQIEESKVIQDLLAPFDTEEIIHDDDRIIAESRPEEGRPLFDSINESPTHTINFVPTAKQESDFTIPPGPGGSYNDRRKDSDGELVSPDLPSSIGLNLAPPNKRRYTGSNKTKHTQPDREIDDSVIINTDVNDIGLNAGSGAQNGSGPNIFTLVENLLTENRALLLANQVLRDEVAHLKVARERSSVLQEHMDHLETQLVHKDRKIGDLEAEVHSLSARINARFEVDAEFKGNLNAIEANYERSLHDNLQHIERYKDAIKTLREKEENKLTVSKTEVSHAKDELISRLQQLEQSLQSSVPTVEDDGLDDTALFRELEKSIKKEYFFDEKLVIDNRVEVDPDVLRLDKELEKLYSRKYDGVKNAAHPKKEPINIHIIENIGHIFTQNDRNRAKYLEEMNHIISEAHASINSDALDIPSFDEIFPPVSPAQKISKHTDRENPNKKVFSKQANNPNKKATKDDKNEKLPFPGLNASVSDPFSNSDRNMNFPSPDVTGNKNLTSAARVNQPWPSAEMHPSRHPKIQSVDITAQENLIDIRKNVRSMSKHEDNGMTNKNLNKWGAFGGQVRPSSQTHLAYTVRDVHRDAYLEDKLLPENQEISEGEYDGSDHGFPNDQLIMDKEEDGEEEQESNNPFDDYEAKVLTIKDNLSYASNMNTPRNLSLLSPMHVQHQRRFNSRNVPMSFSDVSKQQAILEKYHAKPQEVPEHSTPNSEARGRHELISKASEKSLSEKKSSETELKIIEIHEPIMPSPTDLSKRKSKSALYLIPEGPETEDTRIKRFVNNKTPSKAVAEEIKSSDNSDDDVKKDDFKLEGLITPTKNISIADTSRENELAIKRPQREEPENERNALDDIGFEDKEESGPPSPSKVPEPSLPANPQISRVEQSPNLNLHTPPPRHSRGTLEQIKSKELALKVTTSSPSNLENSSLDRTESNPEHQMTPTEKKAEPELKTVAESPLIHMSPTGAKTTTIEPTIHQLDVTKPAEDAAEIVKSLNIPPPKKLPPKSLEVSQGQTTGGLAGKKIIAKPRPKFVAVSFQGLTPTDQSEPQPVEVVAKEPEQETKSHEIEQTEAAKSVNNHTIEQPEYKFEDSPVQVRKDSTDELLGSLEDPWQKTTQNLETVKKDSEVPIKGLKKPLIKTYQTAEDVPNTVGIESFDSGSKISGGIESPKFGVPNIIKKKKPITKVLTFGEKDIMRELGLPSLLQPVVREDVGKEKDSSLNELRSVDLESVDHEPRDINPEAKDETQQKIQMTQAETNDKPPLRKVFKQTKVPKKV